MTYVPCTLRGVCRTLDGRAATGKLVIRPALTPPVIREAGVLVASGPLELDLYDAGDAGEWEVEVPPNDDAALTNYMVPYLVTEQLDHQSPREWRSFVVTVAPAGEVVETASIEGGVVEIGVTAVVGQAEVGAPDGVAPLNDAAIVPDVHLPTRLGPSTVESQTSAQSKADAAQEAAELFAQQLVDTVRTEVPTIEELFTSLILDTGSISTYRRIPVLVAPYNMSIEQVSLMFQGSVPANVNNYWTATLVRLRDGFPEVIASRSTPTAPGIEGFKEWTFDSATWSSYRNLAKGDVVALQLTPIGTPASLVAPVLTFRAEPTDATPSPSPNVLVRDFYGRADNAASLGTTEVGAKVWAASTSAVAGVISGQAYFPTPLASNTIATIDAADADVSVVLRIPASAALGAAGVVFRHSDDNNLWFTTGTGLWKRVAGAYTQVAAFSYVSGTILRVDALGNHIEVYRRISGGVLTKVADVTDAFNATATKHGLRASGTESGLNRYGDFVVGAL